MTAPRYGSISAVGNRVTPVTRRSNAGMRRMLLLRVAAGAAVDDIRHDDFVRVSDHEVGHCFDPQCRCGASGRSVAVGTGDHGET